MASDNDPFELIQDLTDACTSGDKLKAGAMIKLDEVLSIINVPNDDGETALYCACDNGHSAIVLQLLKVKSIDTQIGSMRTGLTPLHGIAIFVFFTLTRSVACANKHAECVAMLLVCGADTRATDRSGLTPRDLAAKGEISSAFHYWDLKASSKSLLALKRKWPSL